jgi:hypothetical protein
VMDSVMAGLKADSRAYISPARTVRPATLQSGVCMSDRIVRLAFALACVLPATATAQAFEYAPDRAQFRITQVTKASQEAMGQKQDFETSNNQLLSVTVARPSKDTILLTVVVDSTSAMGPMGPDPMAQKLVGVKAEAKLSPTGTLYTTATKDSTIEGAVNMAEATGRFLPRIRGRLAKGGAWADTSIGKLKLSGLEVDRRTFSRYTVEGDTTVAGEKSWKVVRRDSTTMSGSGMMQGQAITMEGTSVGTGSLFLTTKGALIGGQGDEEAKIRLVLSANGMEINITQNANSKIEKVK